MRFAHIAHALRRLAHRRTGGPAGLRPVDEVRRLLGVERVRADRTGQCLSVIAFTPRTPAAAAATTAFLDKHLRGRLRVTDEAGWLDDERVCAVLPFTPAAGAWTVADDVCLLFPDDIPPPICTVYLYPSGNAPQTDGKASPAHPASNGRGHTNGHHTPPAEKGDGRTAVPDGVPLEPLFLRPIPPLKRAVDVVGAGLGILALLPLLPVAALAIKLTSPGPVFFKQRRTGRGGRPFVMWKFRTMVADAEARKADLIAHNEQDGPAFKIKRDPRVTPVGRFLRGTSLDELPQLWNVLRGDMSLVGPRPLPCGEADRCEPWQRRRHDVTPGLTCIWQVRGRSAVSFADWVRMDVRYIETQSLWADLMLILQTVPAMALQKGGH